MLGIKPTITAHPSDQTVVIASCNEWTSLTCEAMHAVSYYWERQSGIFSCGTSGVNTNTLTFVNMSPEDAGNYRCIVCSDNDKTISSYANITIQG